MRAATTRNVRSSSRRLAALRETLPPLVPADAVNPVAALAAVRWCIERRAREERAMGDGGWSSIEDTRVDAAHLAEQSTYVREHGTHVHCANCAACVEGRTACAECGLPCSPGGETVVEHYMRAHGVEP